MTAPQRHLQSTDKVAFSRVLRHWSAGLIARVFAPHRAERARAREALRCQQERSRQQERRAGASPWITAR